jgi:hypothetical protein
MLIVGELINASRKAIAAAIEKTGCRIYPKCCERPARGRC